MNEVDLKWIIAHPNQCHESVSRRSESEPCHKPAVAVRYSADDPTPYPVCASHTRGFCVPLRELLTAAADVADTEGGRRG